MPIMVVLDGLQDISYQTLDGATPYDYGKGENFRRIERAAATGTLETTPPGFEPDTQTCVLTLLGVAPEHIPEGRSYIEALARGIWVEDNDIIMRCNFVRIADDGTMEDPTCTPPEDIAKALLDEVAAVPGNTVTRVGGYKSLQRVDGGCGYIHGMKTFPPHNYSGKPLEELLASGNGLAARLADFSRALLKKYAPYTVFNWAQSVKTALPSFYDLHGISGGMISKTDAPVGGAVAMGMAAPDLPTATGDVDTDLAAKVKETIKLAKERDFVMLHVGGPDEATHRRNEREKADFVSKMDTELIGPILDACPDGTRIMLTCDHIALCSTGGHTAEPVKFFLYEKGASLSGSLGCLPGIHAVKTLLGK